MSGWGKEQARPFLEQGLEKPEPAGQATGKETFQKESRHP